jgi:transposase
MFAVCSHKYDTDLTDDQWEIIKNFIRRTDYGGRPCETDFRRVVDGILYFVKAGCPWRLLPGDFPPWQTVYRYFRRWEKTGVWRKMHLALARQSRALAGREDKPTALAIDSQSVKTGKMVSIDSPELWRKLNKPLHVVLPKIWVELLVGADSTRPIHAASFRQVNKNTCQFWRPAIRSRAGVSMYPC